MRRHRRRGMRHRRIGAEHHPDVGVSEDEPGPLRRIVGVDWHVRRPRGEHAEDCDVELARARGQLHADPVATSDPRRLQPIGDAVRGGHQFPIGEHGRPVVERGLVRDVSCRGVEEVDEGPRCRRGGHRAEHGRPHQCRTDGFVVHTDPVVNARASQY